MRPLSAHHGEPPPVLLLLNPNLQGIYVLQDHSFRWLLRLAPAAPVQEGSRPEFLARSAQPYLYLPCGIIRGERAELQGWAGCVPPWPWCCSESRFTDQTPHACFAPAATAGNDGARVSVAFGQLRWLGFREADADGCAYGANVRSVCSDAAHRCADPPGRQLHCGGGCQGPAQL